MNNEYKKIDSINENKNNKCMLEVFDRISSNIKNEEMLRSEIYKSGKHLDLGRDIKNYGVCYGQ